MRVEDMTGVKMKVWANAVLAAFVFLVLVVAGCGGGGGGTVGGGGGGGGNGITLNFTNLALAFGEQVGLSGTVNGTNNQSISWTATGGTIQRTGESTAVYTAPNVAGTYTITATSDADPTKKGFCTVVVSKISVSLSPKTVTLGPGGIIDFTADAIGATTKNFTFTASSGAITKLTPTTARYIAPSTPGTYTVTATLVEDPTKSDHSTVTVQNNPPQIAIVNGRVIEASFGQGVGGITIDFLNASGSVVKSITTNSDGRYSVQVPITAKFLWLDQSSLGNNYFNEYLFGQDTYSLLVPGCYSSLPTLAVNQTYNIGTITIYPSGDTPPPPPTGCQ